MKTTVPSADILLLAEADSAGATSNARGHLFEEFVAQLMALFGYATPTRSALNVTSHGVELDVTSTHTLTGQKMVAECKAYTSALDAAALSAFYGKLVSERFTEVNLFGYFIAIPRLTKNARELQERLESNDPHFRVCTSETLHTLLLEREEIASFATIAATHHAPGPVSDETLLVTSHGLFYAVHQLSADTRLATRVVVFPANVGVLVPPRILTLLAETTTYTKGLPCVSGTASPMVASVVAHAPAIAEDTVIPVVASSSDFEYQFPAAPQYFVGRPSYVAEGERILGSLGETDAHARVLVLNALSGWGKSSLALRLLDVARTLNGDGVCIDCRTAAQPTFVAAALRYAFLEAQKSKLLKLPTDASFASVPSALRTLRGSTFTRRAPLCIFFDQFENVFQNTALTKEFRDLALGVSDISAPLLLGFSWKTDFVAFTEGYPYQLRDDIRSCATVQSLDPFGPIEIGALIARLQKAGGQKLHPYMRERIREYSQGLPWLFKKLGSHILREFANGTTQDELLSEVLNIQQLFENDISVLNIRERQDLRAIARRAPLPVVEAVELAGGNKDAVNSLINQRLLVTIGENLDVYWDVFRDYLNQGSVPLQDSYILRMTPNGVRKLIIAIDRAGGDTTPDEVATAIHTSVISVLNMARDLRQLGVLAAREGVLRFADTIALAPDLNSAVMARASVALRRHRVHSLLTSLAPIGGRVPITAFAEALPKAYPAVAAKRDAWSNYSRAFAHWLQFAGLVTLERDDIIVGQSPPASLDLLSPGKKRATKGSVFPHSSFQPVLQLLCDIDERRPLKHSSSVQRSMVEAIFLGLAAQNEDTTITLTVNGRALVHAAEEGTRAAVVRSTIEEQPAFRVALPMLMENPACAPTVIGRRLAREMNIDWSDATAHHAGKYVRSWMRAAGIPTTPRESNIDRFTGNLFDDPERPRGS